MKQGGRGARVGLGVELHGAACTTGPAPPNQRQLGRAHDFPVLEKSAKIYVRVEHHGEQTRREEDGTAGLDDKIRIVTGSGEKGLKPAPSCSNWTVSSRMRNGGRAASTQPQPQPYHASTGCMSNSPLVRAPPKARAPVTPGLNQHTFTSSA